MKAPSTKTPGTVLAMALVLIVVALVDPRTPSTTPLHATTTASPDDVAPSAAAVQCTSTGAVELARQSALPLVARREVACEVRPSSRRCEFWCELSVALDRLMEANEAMQAAKGTEVEFRQRQRDYVVVAAQLDGLRDERDEGSSATELLRDEVWERAAARSSRTSAAGNQVPVVLSEPAPDLVHTLRRHDSDPPDAVVFAFRRHFLTDFHAMPVAHRRFLLGDELTAQERAMMSRILPDGTWLFRQRVEARLRPLRDGWTLAER